MGFLKNSKQILDIPDEQTVNDNETEDNNFKPEGRTVEDNETEDNNFNDDLLEKTFLGEASYILRVSNEDLFNTMYDDLPNTSSIFSLNNKYRFFICLDSKIIFVLFNAHL